MQYALSDGVYLMTLERGELAVATLQQFATTKGIKNGYFTGIGAVDQLTCGYYDLAQKQYYFTEYHDLVEVVSLTGNIFLKDGTPFVHVHGVFTNTTNAAFGGHIVEMRVGVTLEVVFTPLASAHTRVPNECIGLALVELPQSFPAEPSVG